MKRPKEIGRRRRGSAAVIRKSYRDIGKEMKSGGGCGLRLQANEAASHGKSL